MKKELHEEIKVKEGVSIQLDGSTLKVKGAKGEIQRDFLHPQVKLIIENNKIILTANRNTKKEKKMLSSFAAHIENMLKGVTEPFTYKLKICSGHFPMNVAVSGDELIIKNFLGESVPRKIKIIPGAQVKVNGNEIEIISTNKEIAGQTAARIENSCRITNRDIRIFQDGCYITHKAGKNI